MKRICNECPLQATCTHIKRRMDYRCSLVQDYNMGYEEAVKKASEVYCRFCPHQCEGHPHEDCQILMEFTEAMKE